MPDPGDNWTQPKRPGADNPRCYPLADERLQDFAALIYDALIDKALDDHNADPTLNWNPHDPDALHPVFELDIDSPDYDPDWDPNPHRGAVMAAYAEAQDTAREILNLIVTYQAPALAALLGAGQDEATRLQLNASLMVPYNLAVKRLLEATFGRGNVKISGGCGVGPGSGDRCVEIKPPTPRGFGPPDSADAELKKQVEKMLREANLLPPGYLTAIYHRQGNKW